MGSGADRPSAVAWSTTREWWKEAGEGQRNEAPLAAQGLHPCLGKAWQARHGEAMDCHNLVERRFVCRVFSLLLMDNSCEKGEDQLADEAAAGSRAGLQQDLAMANRGIVTHRGFSNATLLAPSWY
ncbi:RNA-metabolising metallo-beta-lactamase family protein, partial [Zea mays]